MNDITDKLDSLSSYLDDQIDILKDIKESLEELNSIMEQMIKDLE